MTTSKMTKLLLESDAASNDMASVLYGSYCVELAKRKDIRLFSRGGVSGPRGQDSATELAFDPELLRLIDQELPAENEDFDCIVRFLANGASRRPPPTRRTIVFPPSGCSQFNPGQAQDEATPDFDGADSVVAPSRWSREDLLAQGVAPEKIALIPHGVDVGLFAPLSVSERAETRAQLGFHDDETVLLSFADFGFESGLDLLLRSFAKLRSDGRPVRLVLKAERPAFEPFFDQIRLAVAAEDPLLRQQEIVQAITVVSSSVPRVDLRRLYGMADCYVSPYRTSDFNAPVLESIAVGTPVIITRGGATDDFVNDDVAWRISASLQRGHPTGTSRPLRFLEPDAAELTDAIAEVVRGRGFEMSRFSRARMALLPDFTWRRAAGDLVALLGGGETSLMAASGPYDRDAPLEPVRRTAPIFGLPRPVAPRFVSQRHPDLPEKRRFEENRPRRDIGHSLSVVIQGPCIRVNEGNGVPSLDETLASIRRHFPGAQIIYSSWIGSDIDGLDADDIVLSADPGPLDDGVNRTNNMNRVLTSTVNGLAAATRPFCIKTRNDILFSSDGLARKELWRAADFLSLERRIWVEACRVDTSLRPFHPSDMIQYGTTDDLRRLWDIPIVKQEEAFLPDPKPHIVRSACEQSVFIGYLQGIGIDVSIEHTFDGRYGTIAASIECMLGAFDIFDPPETGVVMTPRFTENQRRPQLMETPESFEALRRDFARDRSGTIGKIYAAHRATLLRLMSVEGPPDIPQASNAVRDVVDAPVCAEGS